jgi:hypothetical protein
VGRYPDISMWESCDETCCYVCIWQTLHHKVIWFVREKQKINIWDPAATSVTLISLITIIIHSQATQWFVFRLSITNITTSLVTRLSHAYIRITTHNIINTYYFIPAIILSNLETNGTSCWISCSFLMNLMHTRTYTF